MIRISTYIGETYIEISLYTTDTLDEPWDEAKERRTVASYHRFAASVYEALSTEKRVLDIESHVYPNVCVNFGKSAGAPVLLSVYNVVHALIEAWVLNDAPAGVIVSNEATDATLAMIEEAIR